MREVSFLRWLTETCRLRHVHVQHKGRVIRFMVQLEVSIQGQWHAVRRYDTAHGLAHYDILHPHGRAEKVPLAFRDFNEALTFAEADLRAHWSLDVQRYAQEVKRYE